MDPEALARLEALLDELERWLEDEDLREARAWEIARRLL